MGNSNIITTRRHPVYEENFDKWVFYLDSFNGGTSYVDKYLYTHRLETAEDYIARKSRAYYLNYCAPLATLPADFIFKKEATRPLDINLQRFRSDVDRSGSNINAFMRRACILSSIFGHVFILVDRPKASDVLVNLANQGKTTKKENLELYPPYAILISPLDVLDWSLDPTNGDLNWVLIREPRYDDADPFAPRESYTLYKIWTRNKWFIVDENQVIQEQGDHNLGFVPIVICYHKDTDKDMIGESMLKDVAETNRAIFNWCSNVDEMIARQTFSQLICPDDGSILSDEVDSEGRSKSLRSVGSSAIFTFPADSRHPPAFISPDTSQIRIIWDMIEQHVREMFRLAGLISAKSSLVNVTQRTGLAQAYEFLDMAVFLASKAKMLEEAENKLNKVVYRWLGINEEPERVYYPDKFDITSPTEIIDIFTKVTLNSISGTLNKEMAKRLAINVLPNADDATMEKINREIDSNKILEDPSVLFNSQPSGKPMQQEVTDNKTTDGERTGVEKTKEVVPNVKNPKERAKFRSTHTS